MVAVEPIAELRGSLADVITGVESPVASGSGSNGSSGDDDITPFPSPMLSATSMAGLSREPRVAVFSRKAGPVYDDVRG